MNKSRFSLRTKLTLTFLVVIVIGGLLTLFVGFRLVRNTLVSQAQAKVKHDLASAWMVFNGKLHEIQTVISLTAKRESLWDAIQNSRHDTLLRYLGRVRAESGLDILTLTDSRGRVISRTRNPGVQGDDQSSDEIVGQAIERGVVAAPQILGREELLKEGQDLADQASMEFVPTPRAAPRAENRETSGLVLKAAARVLDENQRLLGVLYGGVLLNRNYEIVDQIKGTVFKDEKYKGRETGTATIFQSDFRISTNVVNERGERAIGTLLSREVRQAVLEEGKPWIDRAFVVNDIYITAYEPIRNIGGRIIGILYVGMLEKPYLDVADRVMVTFIGIAVLCVVFLLAILNFSTIRIIRPLEKMVTATREIAAGDLSHRVEVESRDELGILAESFNQMISQLKEANEELVMWGKTLEKKVQDRTRELKDIQDHLLQAEKLASLGKLAAGIAHEINNPLGGVLIYAHLILEDLQEGSPHYRNLGKIVKETERCRTIVKGLLEFARPKEPEMIPTDVNEVLETSVSLLERQALFQNITIKKAYAPHLARIVADGAQLQQVFMNIILNAAEAMDGNGVLTLKTFLDERGGYLAVEISDTGRGIRDEDMKRLFEPFFTTKEAGKGTGLGLAISYGIIQKHSGSIDVESRVGEGTLFRIKLPLKRETAHD